MLPRVMFQPLWGGWQRSHHQSPLLSRKRLPQACTKLPLGRAGSYRESSKPSDISWATYI